MKNRFFLMLMMFCVTLVFLPAAASGSIGAEEGRSNVFDLAAFQFGIPGQLGYGDSAGKGSPQPFFSTQDTGDSYDGTYNIETDEATGSGYSFISSELYIEVDGKYLIYGTGESTYKRIRVKANVTAEITIKDVNLEIVLPFECANNSNVTLVLADDSENIFRGGGGHAGLNVFSTASLTITTAGQDLGNGSLSAYGGGDSSSYHASAGIGGSELAASGTIVIDGGTIFAKGGDGRSPGAWKGPGGAGIGGAKGYPCGDITINGGSVTAIGGNVHCNSAAIGGGSSDSVSGKIAINGGTVRAYSGQPSNADWSAATGIGFCETVTISDAADVQAYSAGDFSAISATVGEGDHSACLLNLMLPEAVTVNTDITIVRTADGTEVLELTLPEKYDNFAATMPASEDPEKYNVRTSDGFKKIVAAADDDPDLPGIYQTEGEEFPALNVKFLLVPKESLPEAAFTAKGYAEGELTVVNDALKYSVDGGTTWISVSATAIDISDVTPEKGIMVYQPGNPPDTVDSEIQSITVTRMDEPDGVTKTDCGTGSNNDGTLTGVTAAMEYKPSAAVSWLAGTGSVITGLVPGAYDVRSKAAAAALASDYITLSIASSGITQIAKPVANTGLKWTGSAQRGVADGSGYQLNGVYEATAVGNYAATAVLEPGYEWADGTTANVVVSWQIARAVGVEAPAGLTAVRPSVLGGSNGKITGTTVLMEYADNAGFSNPIICGAGETTGLGAGTYYVRVKATATHEPGAYATVAIPDGDSLSRLFTDVKDSDWFYDAVRYVYENELMVGTAASAFSPHVGTTRGMIVTILHRLEGSPQTKAVNPFSDVVSGKWYTEAIIWAAEHKIVDGYGNGKFGPNDLITREQMAAILFRYAEYRGYDLAPGTDLSGFVDKAAVSGWAFAAMSWANAAGLIQGDGVRLTPLGQAERCQAAAVLQRFIENIAK